MGKAALTNSMEDYLEAISILEDEKKYVRVKDIAKYMRVKMPSVTGALKLLSDKDLVNHERYEYVELTDKGTAIAKGIRKRHNAVLKFLTEVLDVDPKTAESDACGIEHAMSTATLDRLLKMIECLEECPKGSPECIQRFRLYAEHGEKPPLTCISNEIEPKKTYLTLDMLEPGVKAKITKVCGKGALRRRMMDMGIVPGAVLELEREAPLGDPIEMKIKDCHLSLRKEEATNIFLEVI